MLRVVFFSLFILIFSLEAGAQEKSVHIYQDADLSNHVESSRAIQMGIEVAFNEIGNEIEGYEIVFKYLNHRGNVVRSKLNYKTFISDPKALAIYSGIHSPPLIRNREFINKSKALTLVPWAAGGPVTRYPSAENWVFRLSVDDTRAGPVIIDFAMKNKGCKAPHLLLEDTPWGQSNLKSMSKALIERGIVNPRVSRFGWNLKPQSARALLHDIVEGGGDCVVLVGNAIEGKEIAQAMIDLPNEKRVPLISHWGITGGNFHHTIDAEARKNLELYFIQTCFAFTNPEQSEFAKDVFKRLQKLYPNEFDLAGDLKSAVGFIHAYDLTKILIAAIRQTGLSGDMVADRDAIRKALENLEMPIEGLVKHYQKPFSKFDVATNFNAHEALDDTHYCMGSYGPKDEILIIGKGN